MHWQANRRRKFLHHIPIFFSLRRQKPVAKIVTPISLSTFAEDSIAVFALRTLYQLQFYNTLAAKPPDLQYKWIKHYYKFLFPLSLSLFRSSPLFKYACSIWYSVLRGRNKIHILFAFGICIFYYFAFTLHFSNVARSMANITIRGEQHCNALINWKFPYLHEITTKRNRARATKKNPKFNWIRSMERNGRKKRWQEKK